MEEKENPNYMRARLEKMKGIEAKIGKKLAATKAFAKEVAKIDDEVAGMIAQGVEVFIDFTFLKQIQTLSNMLLNVN